MLSIEASYADVLADGGKRHTMKDGRSRRWRKVRIFVERVVGVSRFDRACLFTIDWRYPIGWLEL